MDIAYWHWWVVGFALFVAEMLLPTGFVLIWIGAAAIVVGVAAWMIPTLSWQIESVMFAVGSLLSFFVWKRFRPHEVATDKPTLNQRGRSYVGRNFTLSEPIVNGVGKLSVDDSQWRVNGPDTPAGAQVRVVSADGSTLKVERAA